MQGRAGIGRTAHGVCLLLFWVCLAGQAYGEYLLEQGITYRTDVELPDGQADRLTLDVYVPKDKPGFSTVVWFHGGGLTQGRKEIPAALKERGIAVVAANYRLSPGVKAPAYIEDAAAAVAWVFRNISKYGGSRDRIFVSGHSAGGYLSAMVGLDQRWLKAHDIDANRIAGLIPFSGQCITHFTIRSERGVSDKQAVIDEYAPLFHVRSDAPPMLLISGDREMELLGRYEENAYLARMMKVAGHQGTTLYELQGFDHGGMATPAFPLLLRFVEQRSSLISENVSINNVGSLSPTFSESRGDDCRN
ncbi:MAG: alpha/beta hydrolase [Planctomyces sp.]|nr:alpha/beta hydrolase [Planctomyces sp.]